MSQFIQTNGDYTIKTRSEGIITLDTGPNIGEVRVTGNLIVEGETLTIAAAELQVDDNIILLNRGETQAGISRRRSGVQIDRGTLSDASFFYDENDDTWNFAEGSAEIGGPFTYDNSYLKIRGLRSNPSTDDGDLTLNVGSSGVVNIVTTSNYEDRVINRNDIPNKGYVDDAIRDNPTFQILDNDTRVIVTDVDISGSEAFFTSETGYNTGGESAISVLVDGLLISQFFSNRLEVGDLEIGGGALRNEITLRSSITDENLYFRTQGTGKVQIDYGLQIEKITTIPASVPGSVILSAQDPAEGDTGLYFTNSSKDGELVSKNRALLFGMLF